MRPEESGERFASVAEALLGHLRAPAPELGEGGVLRRTVALLAELYAAGLALPQEEAPPEDVTGRRPLLPPVPLRLDTPRAYYRHADPRRAGTEEVGDLEEDLEDLLAEVMRGLSAYGDGTPSGPARARAHWRKSLPHWGHHAVEAMRALHYRLLGLPG